MHLDLIKTTLSIIGFFGSFKLIFFFFSAAETLTMLLVGIILFALYSVQRIEWNYQSTTSLFGITLRSESTYYSQYTLFGIIPISKPKKCVSQVAYLEEVNLYKFAAIGSKLSSLLPMGGMLPRLKK